MRKRFLYASNLFDIEMVVLRCKYNFWDLLLQEPVMESSHEDLAVSIESYILQEYNLWYHLSSHLSMDSLKSSEKELFASIFIRYDVSVKQGIGNFKETF